MKKLILATFLFPLIFFTAVSSVKALCTFVAYGGCTPPGLYCNISNQNYCCGSSTECTGSGGTVINSSCVNTNNPEFHSLRPYPFSPCQNTPEKYATFCGNNLTIQEKIGENFPGGGSCTYTNDAVTCNYNASVNKTISIDLKGASLPFMGNTEDVKNSINKSDTTSADKVNNYVSWYLNGTNNRAEYGGFSTGDNLIKYSGPINKLLPSVILEAQRIKSINNVVSGTNHNQIVVCANSDIPLGNLLDIGYFTPIDCYKGDGSKAQGQIFRLKSEGIIFDTNPIIRSITDGAYGWDGSLSWMRDISNFFQGIRQTILDTLINNLPIQNFTAFKGLPISQIKDIIKSAIDDSISGAWNKKTPPLPWDDGTGKPFADQLLYQKAYNEWKGKTCIVIPVIGKLFCFDNFFIPSKYADLYSYVPLSSTEDLQGNIIVNSATGTTTNGGTTITGLTFSNQTPATLFFPHVQESSELGTLLQTTYVPKGQAYIGSPTETSSQTSCNPVEVRSNKGDSITNGSSVIGGDLFYNASFSCTFSPNAYTDCVLKCQTAKPDANCEGLCQPVLSTVPVQTCEKTISVDLSTEVNAPKLDDVWSQLVAGPTAIVKRLFPKLGSQLGTLEDIPGSTGITYSGAANSNGTLNIPHVGGIDEYFLNGIQTLLRPKGFGEPITFGPPTATSSPGPIANVCTANCNHDPANVDMTGVKEKFIDLANRWLGTVKGNPRIDMYDTVVTAAKNAGVDPILTLAIWLNESGASNYLGTCLVQGQGDPNSINCQRAQDFGINSQSIETQYDSTGKIIVDHFMDQLQSFLGLPSYYYQTCNNHSTAECPLEIFGAMFKPGQCNPTADSNSYIKSIEGIYNDLKPGQLFACYPIKLQ